MDRSFYNLAAWCAGGGFKGDRKRDALVKAAFAKFVEGNICDGEERPNAPAIAKGAVQRKRCAPVTGQIMAQLLCGETPEIGIAKLAPARFG